MKIARHSWVAGEREVVAYRTQLAASAATAGAGSPPSADELCDPNATIDWAIVDRSFHSNAAAVGETLRKLHFRRAREIADAALQNIWRFLLQGYARTNDVRYFNELLWFARGAEFTAGGQTAGLALGLFFSNLDSRGRHVFPHGTADEITRWIGSLTELSRSFVKQEHPGVRVGLLGSPSFFRDIRSELAGLRFEPHCYLVRHHSDRLPRMLLRSPIMLRIFLAMKGANFPFEDLGSDPASPSIGEALKRDGIDLCFHKLGFIIKKGTIDGPRLGIINDHWGALPYVRGRSTIEWSLIHGIPLVATTHLVDEGIDTGRLIGMFDYSAAIAGMSSVAKIRQVVKRDTDRRVVLSVCRLANGESVVVGNPPTVGATFYSMHPELTGHLESAVLGS